MYTTTQHCFSEREFYILTTFLDFRMIILVFLILPLFSVAYCKYSIRSSLSIKYIHDLTRFSWHVIRYSFCKGILCFSTRIASEGHKGPRPRRISEPSADEEDLAKLTPEERERRKSFESKRKSHYNEFFAVKMARQLMHENEDYDEDSAEKKSSKQDSKSSATVTAATATASSPSEASSNSPMDTSHP